MTTSQKHEQILTKKPRFEASSTNI